MQTNGKLKHLKQTFVCVAIFVTFFLSGKMVEINVLCVIQSHRKVGSLWRDSGLSWADFIPETEDVHSFITEHVSLYLHSLSLICANYQNIHLLSSCSVLNEIHF